MPLTDEGKKRALAALGTAITHFSLHTAAPDASGSNEVAGGTPAYARKAKTWNTPASGSMDDSNTVTFDVPAATTPTHVGAWDHVSATGSTHFLGYAAIPSPETFAAQGQLTVDDADIDLNA